MDAASDAGLDASRRGRSRRAVSSWPDASVTDFKSANDGLRQGAALFPSTGDRSTLRTNQALGAAAQGTQQLHRDVWFAAPEAPVAVSGEVLNFSKELLNANSDVLTRGGMLSTRALQVRDDAENLLTTQSWAAQFRALLQRATTCIQLSWLLLNKTS